MLKNTLKIALRNLAKRKSITVIHLLGLTVGITVFWMIVQYVSFEKSYDRFHTKADRIYRIDINFYKDGEIIDRDAMNYPPAGPALVEELPEVIFFLRITPEYGKVIFRRDDVLFEEKKVFYADSTMFSLFDYRFIEGTAADALNGYNKLVLSLSLAEKYFGPKDDWQTSPLGQLINFNDNMDLVVSGVVEDTPENTHLKFNALISFDTFEKSIGDISNAWGWNDFYTYVLTTPEATRETLQSKMPAFVDRHKPEGHGNEFIAQPLTHIHLHSHQSDEPETNGDITIVNALMTIAFVILIIAWINYINLSTARGQERAREVGIRKVSGAKTGSLIAQFLGEAFLLNFFAIILSLLLAYLAIPYLGHVIGKEITFTLVKQPTFWLGIAALIIGGTLFSGLYPAFVLSSFNPSAVLKGSSENVRNKELLRKGLIMVQFTVAMVLIIGTMVIYNQVNYMQNKALGFDLDHKLIIDAPGIYGDDSVYKAKYLTFRNEIKQIAGIGEVTLSSAIPGGNLEFEVAVNSLRLEGKDEYKRFWVYAIDNDFINTYKLKVIAGKDFSPSLKNDKEESIINRSGARQFGYNNPVDIIGEKIQFYEGDYEIIGVVEDYHHQSVRNAFLPMVMVNSVEDALFYTVNLKPSVQGDVKILLDNLQSTWKKVYPENPFSYFFLEDRYNYQYQADLQIGKVFLAFSFFAILITCLGLFGLSSYMVIMRAKEIGIRKVLGASRRQIVVILSKDFMTLLVFSAIIAVPLGYYFFSLWLEDFAWHIDISVWLLGIPVILVGLLSFLTVSGLSFRAASINPVESLKDE